MPVWALNLLIPAAESLGIAVVAAATAYGTTHDLTATKAAFFAALVGKFMPAQITGGRA